jgi:HEAT repeat protein
MNTLNPLTRFSAIVVAICSLSIATAARAYVDLAPTLARVVNDSRSIALVEVSDYDRDQHIVTLKAIKALKGDMPADAIKHQVSSGEKSAVPRQILQWAEPGAKAVLFSSRNTALVCVGPAWYQVKAGANGQWKLGNDRPDLPLAYDGTLSRLATGIDLMLAGKDAVLTTITYGNDDVSTSFDLALNRMNIPGLARVQRIRANLKMPQAVMAASANPAYLIGQGPVDEADLPALIENLSSNDDTVRAESAEDLGWLDGKATSAIDPLAKLLNDPSSRVRLSAAAALLRIEKKDAHDELKILTAGMGDADPAVRRNAAKAAGLAGPAAAPLTGKLVELLKDSDESTRIAALLSITALGPAAARTDAAPAAVAAITPMLDDPELMIDAADALGRLGAVARPVPPKMIEMLKSDQAAVRWAAVRGMSQIGGPEAHPAVDFMVQALPKATEVEGYNMMMYFALLGPVAKDAAPAIQGTRIKNPWLPTATLWAIEANQTFPWLAGGRGGRFGGGPVGPGPGGGPGGDDGGPGVYIYEAYVQELGDRLAPAAQTLAKKIMDNTAGTVPTWGYKILACGPQESLAVLTPHLADEDANLRERAAVALGYMGSAAAPAKDQLTTAMNKADSAREKKLIAWAVREIEKGD